MLPKRLQSVFIRISDFMPTFNNTNDLDNYIKKCMSVALKNTANTLKDKLREFIDTDFYLKYKPKIYQRSEQFKNSPEIDMVSDLIADIFVNTDAMDYKEATGDYVAQLATKGYHGNTAIFREGYFWQDFIEYAKKNTLDVYKSELKKQGLDVI